MKRLILLLMLLIFNLRLIAQESIDCVEAAEQASVVIASAQTLLAEGNTQGASTLLDAARTLLDNCTATPDTSQPVSTPSAEATESIVPSVESTVEATEVPAPVSEATEEASTNPQGNSANYVLSAPPIDENNAIAFVRFAHTSVDAGAIDIYMGRDNLLVLSNLNYGEATEFIPIQAGERTFRARRHGAGAESEVLYAMTWDYLGNSSWIVTAAGLVDEFAFIVEPISVIRNNYDGMARLRVVNLIAGVERLTVTADNGLVLGDGLGWVGIRDTMLEAGTYTLQGSSANGASFPEPLNLTFEANVTYTLYVMGRGTAESPLYVLNMVSPADSTRVLFRNNAAATVDVHYRPGNLRLIESLATGVSSDWLSLLSGAYTFISYAPNTGPTGQELAAIATQLRPQRYMVFELVGSSINLVYEGLTPPENE